MILINPLNFLMQLYCMKPVGYFLDQAIKESGDKKFSFTRYIIAHFSYFFCDTGVSLTHNQWKTRERDKYNHTRTFID